LQGIVPIKFQTTLSSKAANLKTYLDTQTTARVRTAERP